MLIQVIHRTRYLYSEPVFLEPYTVRLRPRSDATQTLLRYQIDVTPKPTGISHCNGLDGTGFETIWFNDQHNRLSIEVSSLVETHANDPFNFLITTAMGLTLPQRYDTHLDIALAPYRVCETAQAKTSAFVHELLQTADNNTVSFLSMLAREIFQRLKYIVREHGDPWTAEETLIQGCGSCRDFAVLYMEVCRHVGIAARFVSGYIIGDDNTGNQLHAWAEVYLTGAGWRGFDPSHGFAVNDRYVAVAAGPSFRDAAPTHGSFRGNATSTMEAEVLITKANTPIEKSK